MLAGQGGCGSGPPGEVGQLVFEDPVGGDEQARTAAEELAAVSWVGTTPEGELAWFAGDSGRPLAVAPGRRSGSREALVWDSAAARVVELRAGDWAGTTGGMLWAYPLRLGRPTFGVPLALGEAAPGARLWPAPTGLVLFEPCEPAAVWRLVGADERLSPHLDLPLPSSAWHRSAPSRIGAAAPSHRGPAEAIRWLEIDVRPDGLELLLDRAIGALPGSDGVAPRLAAHPSGVVAAVAVRGELVLGLVSFEGELRGQLRLPIESERLVELREVRPARRSVAQYALLLADPPRVALLRLDEPAALGSLELEGELAAGGDELGGQLVTWGSHLWVATTAGVRALEVADAGAEPRLVPNGAFAGESLRGPLAGPIVRPGGRSALP